MFHKKITSKRGITIPKELAVEVGMESGTPVDIDVVDGKVVIGKHVPKCRFCGDKFSPMTNFKGVEICQSCAAEIGEAVTK